VVLEAGDIVERGRHAELIERNGLYADLHATQFTFDGPRPTRA
jgi:ABC-type transport system involved in Fe-S cluster assembly fused permease/ATPase subunit